MKAMLETAPNGHDPKGYYTRYRFAAVMNATVPSLGSRDDRRRLEELFDQVDTGNWARDTSDTLLWLCALACSSIKLDETPRC